MIRSSSCRGLAAAALALVAAVPAGTAFADSTPVGPLPTPTVTTVQAPRGALVAVALPRQRGSTGLVWRLARKLDSGVVRQVGEADVGTSVVIVYKAVGVGTAAIVFALTRGETAKAVRAVVHNVRVR